MSAADFVLYFGVIEGLSNWLFQLARNLDQLYRSHLGFCEIREFLDLTPGDPRRGAPSRRAFLHRIPPCQLPLRRQRGGHHPRPELCDPQRGKTGDCRSQRRGKDHACKTDLRFLHPFCRLRFHRRHRYPAIWAQSVLQAFSAVFQEIFLLPVSVACNVSALPVEETDREKVQQVLEQAGLWEKIQSLPQGMDTRLIRSAQDDAVDLSGGETQKLALARALYKNGLALLLDEPTAALDPIAESEIYQQYNQMTRRAHRCLYLSPAGQHPLLRPDFLSGKRADCRKRHPRPADGAKGKYAQMFEVQSHYYQKEVPDHAF